MNDAFESHANGLLVCTIRDIYFFDFDQLQFFRQERSVCSSFSIQYQSTEVGSLPSLSEIELRRSVRGLFLSTYGTFHGRERLYFFGGKYR